MKLFGKKRGKAPARRHAKFRMQKIRKYCLILLVSGFAFATAYGYHTGFFTRIKNDTVILATDAAVKSGLTVNEIMITGRHYTAPADILPRIANVEGQPVFTVDIASLQDDLQKLPWIEQARITRRLPDKIVIELTERRPLSRWQYRKKLRLIDRNGAVIDGARMEQWQHLPLVVGEDAPLHAQSLIALLRAEPDIAAEMTSAVRIGNRRWDLHLKNDIIVKLPEHDIELALRKLGMQQKNNKILSRGIAHIDLRLPDRFVVEQTAPENGVPANEKNI